MRKIKIVIVVLSAVIILAYTIFSTYITTSIFNVFNSASFGGFPDDILREEFESDTKKSKETLILSDTELTMERGESVLAFFALNKAIQLVTYGVHIDTVNCPDNWKIEGVCRKTQSWFEYFRGDQQYEQQTEYRANKLIITVSKNVRIGLYEINFIAYEGNWQEPCPDDHDPDLNPSHCLPIGETKLFLTVI